MAKEVQILWNVFSSTVKLQTILFCLHDGAFNVYVVDSHT